MLIDDRVSARHSFYSRLFLSDFTPTFVLEMASLTTPSVESARSAEDVAAMTPSEKMQELLLLLNKKREEIEAEISGIVEYLQTPQPSGAIPGLKGNLIDDEGFPRADLDIHMIRIQRNRLAHLQTDHQTNMKAIEKLLPQLHAMYKAENIQRPDQNTESNLPSKNVTPSRRVLPRAELGRHQANSSLQYPVARVEKVDINSPGAKAGLLVGDRILSFGTILRTVGGMQDLRRLSQHLKENENKEIDIVVLRGTNVVNLVLVPSKWEGNGLLGCFLVKEE